ncbi:MAG: hypothetical protein ACREL3_12595, partial [Gemmatimonadales bacterium]
VQFLTCEQTGTINLAAPTRVLIIGQIRATPETLGSLGTGRCHVGSNIGFLPDSQAHISVKDQQDSITMSGVTDVVGPGPIAFGLDCDESSGGLQFDDAHLSYVELSPGSP